MENIYDEFNLLKEDLQKLGIEILKIVKIGNGTMDFHEVHYQSPKYEEVKTVYVQRHKLDELIQQFKEAYAV